MSGGAMARSFGFGTPLTLLLRGRASTFVGLVHLLRGPPVRGRQQWLAGLLAGWLACWLAGLLACWLAGLLACWLAGLLACWLAGLLAC